MPKYRKKPVVIEAEQFFRDQHFDGKHTDFLQRIAATVAPA